MVVLYNNNFDLELTFSMNDQYGIFGFLHPDHILLSFLIVGPFIGIFGMGLYVFLLAYFEPYVVNSMMLLEPALGQFLGTILGQDSWPSIVTYIGTLGMSFGLALIIKGSIEKTENKIYPKDRVPAFSDQGSLLEEDSKL